jgi:hypothetical protein
MPLKADWMQTANESSQRREKRIVMLLMEEESSRRRVDGTMLDDEPKAQIWMMWNNAVVLQVRSTVRMNCSEQAVDSTAIQICLNARERSDRVFDSDFNGTIIAHLSKIERQRDFVFIRIDGEFEDDFVGGLIVDFHY